MDNISNRIKQQFYDGKSSSIGKKEYWSATDYWNAYYIDKILPEINVYDIKDYKKQLKEAEVYYKKNF